MSCQFVDYLYSTDNSLWNPEHEKIYQNMDRPLAQYWINSSHNTYAIVITSITLFTRFQISDG